ncbi:MAG: hypothetical protein KAV45_02575 [Calditrichia bacterium]|nr:hypothetical protein [Calditrichia bacterium]
MTLKGNLLGAPRAEADQEMLSTAFVQSHDYRALTQTNDFNFVVGRRGTGKTALFIKVSEFFHDDNHVYLYKVTPEEYSALSVRAVLERLENNYLSNRAICRVSWKANLLIGILKDLRTHWKIGKTSDDKYLQGFYSTNQALCKFDTINRFSDLVKVASEEANSKSEIPKRIADRVDLSKLQTAVQASLEALNLSVLYLFDNLDEGWLPGPESVAILGGLALAAADLRDSRSQVHSILFIRDNIFRALATSDPDFSRHIEGNTLRLHWNEESLFHLVAERLRVSLSLAEVENNTKVWNRFAQRGLKGREGFASCLQYTLFRPRDILVLLNSAFLVAGRANRSELIEEDIETTSRLVAHDRMNDLKHEYSHVFPGIGLFIESFKGRSAKTNYATLIEFLNRVVKENPYSDKHASDFAVLGSGTELFSALYSVGFIGLSESSTPSFLFCHDGARSDIVAIKPESDTMIHPCYWKALEIEGDDVSQDVIVEITDDYKIRVNPEARELRVQMLGQLISELPDLPLGQDGSSRFEEWVFRSIKILFAGDLTNPEKKPNKNSVQRRDIVATNMAEKGFWKRVLDDYSSRQIIFEVKNYEHVKVEDYRQVLSYSGKDYGRFAIIVNRSKNELHNKHERDWVKEMYDHEQNLIVYSLPASFLARCMKKLRNPQRRDYADQQLSKRLDTIIRQYITLKH